MEIKSVTSDPNLKSTFQMLMDLRNDEYVQWKGARSTAAVTYSFKVISLQQCEFGAQIQVGFNETGGPAQQTAEISEFFQATLQHIEGRRNQEIQKMRERLIVAEAWGGTATAVDCLVDENRQFTAVRLNNLHLKQHGPSSGTDVGDKVLAKAFKLKSWADSALTKAGLIVPARVNISPCFTPGCSVYVYSSNVLRFTVYSFYPFVCDES